MDKGILSTHIPFVPELGRDRTGNSILDVEVSCFANYGTATDPKTVNLLYWLSCGAYAKEVRKIRATGDKYVRDSLKGRLPAITPSGTFTYRSEKDLISHSGLIQFDIDLKENTHIDNFYDLKLQISNIPNVAYCGLSVSGQGFWGLIPIAFRERHREHFEALRKTFLQLGITIDVKPRNIASLRGYSYDEEAYFNHNAAVFARYESFQKEKLNPYSGMPGSNDSPVKVRVELRITAIERNGIDVTSSYAAWFEVGCSLAAEFGEEGRCYFHRVSQFHPKYSSTRTDRLYDSCLRGSYTYTIATFFKYCKR
ncbi:BT4734/BF3469 family protein [Rufibacter sp. XAAS-G3-1]|uniref:BT4734/BF3469 family protein n=1 Tax=Rufibacter sp. XAAS-G3-1 TaxID=2729134 RepID=UPI0015E64F4F|nr:BT4734/BF3469 family protein [Rufibacter sp. XAAS-G3-1]